MVIKPSTIAKKLNAAQESEPEAAFEIETVTGVICVQDDTPIIEVVKVMVERKISSVIVCDPKEVITGIITERDIVRKFTLVDLPDKLSRPVATIMTRNVRFVSADSIYDDVLALHEEHRIRHFPILHGTEPKVENLAGIVSISEFVRQFIIAKAKEAPPPPPAKPKPTPPPIAVIGQPKNQALYQKVLEGLGARVILAPTFAAFYSAHGGQNMGVLLDMDGFQHDELKPMVATAHHYKGRLIFATSLMQIIEPFRASLRKDRQAVALKPVDIGYIKWFLERPLDPPKES